MDPFINRPPHSYLLFLKLHLSHTQYILLMLGIRHGRQECSGKDSQTAAHMQAGGISGAGTICEKGWGKYSWKCHILLVHLFPSSVPDVEWHWYRVCDESSGKGIKSVKW